MGKVQVNGADISGKVLEVGPVERISDKFSKRVLYMEVFTGTYANKMPFEFPNDNMKQIADIRANDWVTVHYQLRSTAKQKEGQPERIFVSLVGVSCYRE
jgi:hypothetical protein